MQSYIPYIVSVLALLFSIYQFVRVSERDDTSQITTVLIKLENITELVAEIKEDVREDRQTRQELRERLVSVEESTKSAHKRINTLESQLREHEIICGK